MQMGSLFGLMPGCHLPHNIRDCDEPFVVDKLPCFYVKVTSNAFRGDTKWLTLVSRSITMRYNVHAISPFKYPGIDRALGWCRDSATQVQLPLYNLSLHRNHPGHSDMLIRGHYD